MVFIALIFMKLSTAQWHCVEIFCTEFYQNWLRNMGIMGRNSVKQSTPFTELTFMELKFAQQLFLNNSHSKFHEYSVKDSVTDTKSQIDKQTNKCGLQIVSF
jgi:hypothetical protein